MAHVSAYKLNPSPLSRRGILTSMNKLIIPFLFIACLFIVACSNDDEPKPEISCEYFEATTWDAQLEGSTYPSGYPLSDHFVMQFLTKDRGKCIPSYGDTDYDGQFTYSITKDMITFNGSIVGNWTVKELTKSKMVLQSFQPNEFTLVLSRM